MELKDCFIGKIVKTKEGTPVHIVGLALNSGGEAILRVEHPAVNSLYDDTIKAMLNDAHTSKVTSECVRYQNEIMCIHPSNVEEL